LIASETGGLSNRTLIGFGPVPGENRIQTKYYHTPRYITNAPHSRTDPLTTTFEAVQEEAALRYERFGTGKQVCETPKYAFYRDLIQCFTNWKRGGGREIFGKF